MIDSIFAVSKINHCISFMQCFSQLCDTIYMCGDLIMGYCGFPFLIRRKHFLISMSKMFFIVFMSSEVLYFRRVIAQQRKVKFNWNCLKKKTMRNHVQSESSVMMFKCVVTFIEQMQAELESKLHKHQKIFFKASIELLTF
jgi:hypothetical protein